MYCYTWQKRHRSDITAMSLPNGFTSHLGAMSQRRRRRRRVAGCKWALSYSECCPKFHKCLSKHLNCSSINDDALTHDMCSVFIPRSNDNHDKIHVSDVVMFTVKLNGDGSFHHDLFPEVTGIYSSETQDSR